MEQSNFTYYQFYQNLGYPIFIRLGVSLKEGRVQKLIKDLGFEELDSKTAKKIAVNKMLTKVLTVTKASPRSYQQIMGSSSLDVYGKEVLTKNKNFDIYLCRRIGMMIFSQYSNVWELGVASDLETTEDLMAMRVMLNRFLSWALAPLGVVGYWGITSNEGIVVMKQDQSFGEVVYIDIHKNAVLSSTGHAKLEGGLKILRSAKSPNYSKKINREELISFLSTSTTYFAHGNLPINLKRVVMKIGSMAIGEYSEITSSNPDLSYS